MNTPMLVHGNGKIADGGGSFAIILPQGKNLVGVRVGARNIASPQVWARVTLDPTDEKWTGMSLLILDDYISYNGTKAIILSWYGEIPLPEDKSFTLNFYLHNLSGATLEYGGSAYLGDGK